LLKRWEALPISEKTRPTSPRGIIAMPIAQRDNHFSAISKAPRIFPMIANANKERENTQIKIDVHFIS